ncbi:HAD-like domain-containing protein [Trichoderma barbatum]
MEPTQMKVVFFDLDGTLFDHYHSLRLAISAMQRKYTGLAGTNVEELIDQYNLALQRSYDAYLDKLITYEEADIQKIHLFFASLGLPKPSLDEVQEFRDAYKAVYRENRRATPGSIEALARLREHGYRIAIITNGQVEDQAAKAKAIGILHLIDRIITSEETGYRKPDRRIFQYAIEQLNASFDTYMIGDSADSDIKGALDAQLAAIIYSPTAQNTQSLLFGQQIPIIRHLAQLLDYFGIASHRFKPRFTSAPGQLVIEGIGIDLVTEPRHCLQISKEGVKFLAERIGMALDCAAKKSHIEAMSHIESMIRAISKAAGPIDEEAIQISFPGREVGVTMTNKPDCHVTDRDHSMRAEYVRLALDTVPENEGALREVASLLQGHCNDLMRDYPRAAIRQLRCVMLILAEQAGIRQNTTITGEQIDQ